MINHLVFMDDLKLCGSNEREAEKLTNTVRIFTKNIRMEFAVNKWAHVTMKRGKLVNKKGEIIEELETEKGYKYLGILEADDLMHDKMKHTIRKEYYRRVRQICSSNLNGGNTISVINSRAVSLVRYGAGVLKWTKEGLKVIDRKTRKIMNMNRMHHPRSDTDRLYISQKESGRGLLSIVECVENEERNLSLYLEKSTERLLQLVRNEGISPEFNETVEIAKERGQEERRNQWREKQLHGKFLRDIEGTRSVESWR